MSRNKILNGECQHCGGHTQFPAESIGLTMACPQCGKQTELLLAAPPEEPTVPLKTIVFTAIAVLLLVGGLIAAMIAVKRLQRTAEQRRTTVASDSSQRNSPTNPTSPFAQAGFQVSVVTLEKAAGSSAVYAVGNIRNETSRRRLGIKLELELLDAAGNKVGTATNHHQALEPNAEWRFRTLVTPPDCTSARIISIQADP